jgi:hypothetical protein
VGIFVFFLFNREIGSLSWSGMVESMGLFALGKAGLLVLTEWQITTQWRNWIPVP